MKKVIYIIVLLIGATTIAQTITVNGTPMLVSDDISFPFWLESGSSISPEVPVSSISVLEFNIVPNNNGNDMVFNQVISVTEGQTVPEGKTWKVESILMENQGFNYEENNDPNVINNGEYQSIHQTGLHLKFYEPDLISFISSVFLYAEILPGGGSAANHKGFCFSLNNSSPDLNDDSVFQGEGSVGSSFKNNLAVGFDLLPDTTYYIRAFASNDAGITYSNTYEFTTPNLYVGKPYQGGHICYIDNTNQHGYIIANEVLFNDIDLDCYSNELSSDFGAGISNTQTLIDIGCGNVQNVLNDFHETYVDWFIPSYGELYYLCNLGKTNGSFSPNTWMNTNVNYSYNGVNFSSFDPQPDEFEDIFGLFNIGPTGDTYLVSNVSGSYNELDPSSCSNDGGNNNHNVLLFREF